MTTSLRVRSKNAERVEHASRRQAAACAAARRTSTAAGRRAGSRPTAPYCSGSPRQPRSRCSASNARCVAGPPAAGVGGVHVVVVHERARVQQLERRAGAHQRRPRRRRSAATARKPPVAERRAEPLAAGHRGVRASTSRAASVAERRRAGSACSSTNASSAAWIAGAEGVRVPGRGRVTRRAYGRPETGRRRGVPLVDVGPLCCCVWRRGRPRVPTAPGQRPARRRASGPSPSSSSRPRTRPASGSCGARSASSRPLRPTFVSVTYGAGGTTRDRTDRDHRADRPRDHADARWRT